MFRVTSTGVIVLFCRDRGLVPRLFFNMSTELHNMFETFRPCVSARLIRWFNDELRISIARTSVVAHRLVRKFAFQRLHDGERQRVTRL